MIVGEQKVWPHSRVMTLRWGGGRGKSSARSFADTSTAASAALASSGESGVICLCSVRLAQGHTIQIQALSALGVSSSTDDL